MRSQPLLIALTLVVVALLAGCEHKPTREEEEAAKSTFVCQLNGERLILRFESGGEVRLLTPTAERITLYQIPSASGIRYSNGNLELRGKGMALTLIENGAATELEGCMPYTPPKPPS
ncbi:MAG TPA: MliC family protein [Casimicrobiaceae bacterium]|nr:MliC family protein [Casimicrobiaceae bacterium]